MLGTVLNSLSWVSEVRSGEAVDEVERGLRHDAPAVVDRQGMTAPRRSQ
jgi:hypothetical protein